MSNFHFFGANKKNILFGYRIKKDENKRERER